MPLLTPTERVTLEMIRDKGIVDTAERVAWAREKGLAEPAGKGRHWLTEAGPEALLSDAADRGARRSAGTRRP
jgi:hypothetical protein